VRSGAKQRSRCSITTKASTDGGFPLARQVQKAKAVLTSDGLTLTLEFGSGFADTINFPYSLAQARSRSHALEGVLRHLVCFSRARAHALAPGRSHRRNSFID
jgi:hypothetical protein